MKKVLLGMSGGVDSIWSCRALQREGYEVEGLFLSLHSHADPSKALDASKKLGIKLHIADYSEDFKRDVEDYFVAEYVRGRTPNPCVVCNRRIKFECLLKEADRLGIELVATGHYVRAEREGERFVLKTAADEKKDQSYFLWEFSQEQLSRFVSPLCDSKKTDVIRLVKEENLSDEDGESQEICFIPDNDYASFIKARLAPDELDKAFGEGNFVSVDGKVLGKHKGIASYTVGQRKGLGIALGRPAFVVAINPDEKEVVLGFEEGNRTDAFEVDGLNFVSIAEFVGEIEAFVRPRYRSPLIPANIRVKNGKAYVKT
ncbi:MAG: tRNA 2-thiouridine(34) synthase MnmA, partial [Clostridia bacterium]|nr:tRNA 2-thiouridine(34) synthase MnmA [Clostridia bacterium]